MEITSSQVGDYLEVRATGRLDGSWATHFATTLDELVRHGHHRIRVNLSGVTYISSMGVGVIVECYKNLAQIQGVLVVTQPSPVVRKVLDMVDLSATLMAEPKALRGPGAAAPALVAFAQGEGHFEVYPLSGTGVRCSMLGHPSLIEGCRFGPSHCTAVVFDEEAFGLGLGAFGGGFDDCRSRFGEFVAMAGAAAYQPADDSNAPDFMLGSHTAHPEVQVLYGLRAQGRPSTMARFEATDEAGAVPLTAIAETALDLSGASAAWITIAAESAGLAGVSLRRSPVNGASAAAPFGHPEVRQWLSFTTERAHVRALAVATGLVVSPAHRGLESITRPIGRGTPVRGHLHAAAFSYRPLPQGRIDLGDTVRAIFDHQALEGVLHLIGDDRASDRVSESEFARGALWVAPVTSVETGT